MPRVETYDSPQVAPRAIPNVRQNLRTSGDTFGVGAAQAAQKTSNQFHAIAQDIQNKDDIAAAKQALSAFKVGMNESQYTAEDSYYSRRGENAYKSMPNQFKTLEEARKEFGKALSDRQRQLYDKQSKSLLENEHKSMSIHAAKERINWHNEQDIALIQASIESGALNYNDNADDEKSIIVSVQNAAARNGWPPEKTEIEIQKYVSSMHKSAIDNYLEHDPAGAQEYFEQNKGSIAPSLHDDIRKQIDNQIDSQWSQGKADEIRVAGGSRSVRQAAVNEIEDPNRRKLVRAQVEHDMRQEKAAINEARIEFFDEALKSGMAGVSGSQWAQENPDKWAALEAKQQQAILSGSSPQTDINVYFEIKAALANGDSEAARDKLAKNLHRISSGDQKKLVDQMFKAPKERANIETDKAAFNRSIESLLGPKPSSSKRENRKNWQRKYDVLFGYYAEQIEQWQNDTGKKHMPPAERDKIIDRMMIEGTLEDGGWFWFDKDITIADIEADDLEQIEDIIKERGEPLTPENIMRYATYGQ